MAPTRRQAWGTKSGEAYKPLQHTRPLRCKGPAGGVRREGNAQAPRRKGHASETEQVHTSLPNAEGTVGELGKDPPKTLPSRLQPAVQGRTEALTMIPETSEGLAAVKMC